MTKVTLYKPMSKWEFDTKDQAKSFVVNEVKESNPNCVVLFNCALSGLAIQDGDYIWTIREEGDWR